MKKSTLGKIVTGLSIGAGLTAAGVLGFKLGRSHTCRVSAAILDRMFEQDPEFKDHFKKTFDAYILPELNN